MLAIFGERIGVWGSMGQRGLWSDVVKSTNRAEAGAASGRCSLSRPFRLERTACFTRDRQHNRPSLPDSLGGVVNGIPLLKYCSLTFILTVANPFLLLVAPTKHYSTSLAPDYILPSVIADIMYA